MFFKKRLVVLTIFICSIFINLLSSSKSPLFKSTDLEKDLQYLRQVLEENHPKLYKYTSKEDLALLYTEAEKQLKNQDKMSELDFYLLIAPIVESIKCGHTRILLTDRFKEKELSSKHILPIDIKVINKELYILNTITDDSLKIQGKRIKEINGMSSEHLIQKCFKIFPSDGQNETAKEWAMNRMPFSFLSMLLNFPETYQLTLEDESIQQDQQIEIKAIPLSDFLKVKQSALTATNNNILDFKLLKDKSIAILTIKTFQTIKGINHTEFYKNVFTEIKNNNIKNLVIDLRDNGGGDPENSALLLTYLIEEDFIYFDKNALGYADYKKSIKPSDLLFKGESFCFCNGGSFSSSGHFLSLYKMHHVGLIIGEQSGGSYTCNDNSNIFTLPHSKLRINTARSIYSTQVNPELFTKGLNPDVRVNYTIQDYLNGSDKEFNYLKELLSFPKTTMINNVSFNDSAFNNPIAGCSFLIDTGKDTLAITCKHALWVAKTNAMKSISFGEDLQEWRMQRKDDSLQYVITDKLLNENKDELIGENNVDSDYLIFSIKENHSNIVPLKIRTSDLVQGEELFMIGWSFQDRYNTQRIYKASFYKKTDHHLLMKAPNQNLAGLSGAPVVDKDGLLVGIVSNFYFDNETNEWYLSPCNTDYLTNFLKNMSKDSN